MQKPFPVPNSNLTRSLALLITITLTWTLTRTSTTLPLALTTCLDDIWIVCVCARLSSSQQSARQNMVGLETDSSAESDDGGDDHVPTVE